MTGNVGTDTFTVYSFELYGLNAYLFKRGGVGRSGTTRFVHEKAYLSILSIDDGRINSSIGQFSKARSPIYFMPSPNSTFVSLRLVSKGNYSAVGARRIVKPQIRLELH